MKLTFPLTSMLLVMLLAKCPSSTSAAQDAIDFARDVQPIFRKHCLECHGPDQQLNGYRLDRRRDAMKGGTGTMIGAGNSEGSRLYHKLIGTAFGPQMPPDGPLAATEIEIIRKWIDQGAPWPDELAGELPSTTPDPRATRLMNVLRQGDFGAVRQILQAERNIVNARGPGGATPLMYAVLYGDVELVRIMLEAGANPNDANDAGATALMWAVDNVDKTRLLLRHQANVNAQSADGRTPLLVAAAKPDSYAVIKLLLDHGADPSPSVGTYRGPMNPLRLAAEAADESSVRLLMDRGADVKAFGGVFPLIAAINEQDAACLQLTLPAADRGALRDAGIFFMPPFGSPAALRDARIVQGVFEAGADINARDAEGRTPLMLAVSSDEVTIETVETLIRLGADVNASCQDGRTALDFASQTGQTPFVAVLERAGAKPGSRKEHSVPAPKPAASPRAAVERSLPLLQQADVVFLKKSGCVSCHNNALTAMTIAAARRAGLSVDEDAARTEREMVSAFIEDWRERVLQGMGIPGDSNTVNYVLTGLAADNYPPDLATDALARYLKNDQMPEGRWRVIGNRPPLESSPFEVTAVALRALQAYAPQSQSAEYKTAAWRAADWLRSAEPKTTADRAFQLLGLAWAGDSQESLAAAARTLLAEQREDGGWGQLSTMNSDAYATGQALVALHKAGALQPTDRAYQRGIAFLLSTQLEDGSWYVRSRAIPLQPHFEGGFPHGRDQWISVAATNWASMALIAAVDVEE